MNAIGRTRQQSGILRGTGGYSLVEMMVGIGIAVVIGAGLYAVFNATQRSTVGQRLRNDVQTGCSAAMDQMKSEIALGGYRATDTTTPISDASAGQITFEYWDDRAEFLGGHTNNTRVTFRRAATAESGGGPDGIKPGDLVRESLRYSAGTWDTPAKQVLVSNVQSLSFAYMQSDNTTWDGITLGAIKTIRPTLICESNRVDPTTKKTARVTLTGEVRARNVGVAGAPQDTVKPAAPTDVVVWDEGRCGELQMRWFGNTDADLEGYIVYSGFADGAYTKRSRIARPPQPAANNPEYYTLTGLASARSTDLAADQPMYYIALQSFDKSGNLSDTFSTTVSGNPPGSRRTELAAAAGSDTTIHPLLPPAPVLTATPTPGPTDDSITLNWTTPSVVGLVGYRIYRGDSPGFAVNDTPGTGNRIANETQLGADKTSWVDDDSKPLPGGNLVGCTQYYYKICAVICDTTLVSSYSSAQFGSADAAPTDNAKPPAPTLAAAPGWKRIILNLTNPVRTGMGSTPDFDYTQIYFSTIGPLTMADDGTVMDGGTPARLIPDPTDADRGTFRLDGATEGTINFDDESNVLPPGGDLANPQLAAGTYYFLAVAHDLCLNTSTIETQAEAKADQCNDCDGVSVGQVDCLDAPYPPINVRVDTSIDGNGCYGATTLAWDFPDSYIDTHPDFKAYRILRRELSPGITAFQDASSATEVELSAGWTAKTFTDGGSLDGHVYAYRVEAYDCYYFEWVCSGNSSGGNDPANNISSVKYPPGSGSFPTIDLNGVSLGAPLLDTAVPVQTGKVSGPDGILGNSDDSGDYFHNTATFGIRNSSAAAAPNRLTLDGLTPASVWDNLVAYLQQVLVGDNATTPLTTAFDDGDPTLTHGSTGTDVTFTTPPPLDPFDDTIPVRSRFMNFDRTVSSASDMRSNWIDYTFAYSNPTTGATGCTSRTTFYTPLGPYIYSVNQDRPYFGTLGWPVHGEAGGNFIDTVTVPGSVDVTVSAEILDGGEAGFTAGDVRLYSYTDNAKAFTDEPPQSLFTSTAMTKGPGDQWYATIPAASDASVWYFIVAQDGDGNFDRAPEPWAGSYQYYQQAPDYCATIPNPPTISGSVSGGDVIITWSGPSTNATPFGASYLDGQGYKLYRNRNDGTGWQLHPFHASATTFIDPGDTSFTDSAVPNLATLQYSYHMTAVDLCSPTPNESNPSNIWTETLETDCSNTPSPPVLIKGESFAADGTVILYWSKPTTNEPPSVANPPTDLAGYQVWRRINNGPWVLVASGDVETTCDSGLTADTLSCVDAGPRAVGFNSINTNVFSYYITAFDSCSSGPNYSAGSGIYTESESLNPCADTPQAPALLTGTGGSSSSVAGVDLRWSAPTLNVDLTNYGDAGGFYIERSEDGGASWSRIRTNNSVTLSYFDLPPYLGVVAYQYRVRAFDVCTPSANESGPSATFYENYVGPCGSIPEPPTLLTGSGYSSFSKDGVTLKWSKPTQNATPAGQPYTDPGGYRVYRRLTTVSGALETDGPWGMIAELTASNPYLGSGPFDYTDSSIGDTSPGTPPVYTYDIGDPTRKYSYYVTAIDNCSIANPSDPSTVFVETYTDGCAAMVGQTPPSNPGNLTLDFQNGNVTTGNLSWVAASPAPDGYRVYGCPQDDSAGTTLTCTLVKISAPDPLTGTTYTHSLGTTKVKDIEWFYGVKSVNIGTCDDPSRWNESAGFNANGIQIDPYR